MTSHALKTPSERIANVLSTTFLVALHLSCLLAFVVHFSWGLVALALGGYLLRMWAITTGYHRLFSHRSFKTHRAVQLVLAWLGASSLQNGPIWWASIHRRHHKHSDTPLDAHSPLQRGFFHAHMGWFLDGSHDRADLSNVQDLVRYPELRFVERYKWLPPLTYAVGCWLIAGFPGLVWGFAISTLLVLHATALINSLAHVWGSRRYATDDGSRNNALLAVLTLGEGWHNNHHHYMSSARQGFYWWEVDASYYVLKGLERVGVVWGVRAPPLAVRDAWGARVTARREPAAAA